MFDKEYTLEELSSMGIPTAKAEVDTGFRAVSPDIGTSVRQGKPEERCQPQALRPGAHDAGVLPSAAPWAQRQADRIPGQGQDEFS